MSVRIFWREWEQKRTNSHELLRLALEEYLGQSPIILVEEQDQTRKTLKPDQPECFRQEDIFRLSVKKTKKGKPYFENLPQVKFSISHSENLWACAFNVEKVGLDLQVAYRKDGEKIARRFFHPEEIAWLEKNGFAQFSRVWAHKESYVKFTGRGLAQGLDYFSVVPCLGEGSLKPTGNNACDGDARIFQQEISLREGYWMVLTSNGPQEINVQRF